MSPLVTPDVIVQRAQTYSVEEVEADGSVAFVHRPPPGTGWQYVDGDSAKATWARLLMPPAEDGPGKPAAVIVRLVSVTDQKAGWNVWSHSREGQLELIAERLDATAAFKMARTIHLAFRVHLELPDGWAEQFGPATVIQTGGAT